MASYVEAALTAFKTSETRPVILHTLPATRTKTIDDSTELERSSGLSKSSLAVSRLISVVEIIKREYVKTMDASRLYGLHQYNQIGILEELPTSGELGHNEDQETDRDAMIKSALEGKNFLKQKQTPYMKITLSTVELPKLEGPRTSHQNPLKRVMTKSARKRAKKRRKTEQAEPVAE